MVSSVAWGFALALALALGLGLSAAYAGHVHPVDEELKGPRSDYTQKLLRLIRSWPAPGLPSAPPSRKDGNPVELRCIGTPGRPLYIGVEQRMWIEAPIEAVAKVLDDFSHYKELFAGFDDIHEVSRDGNLVVTYWEQHIPVPFVPNAKWEMTYVNDRSKPSRLIYRYQLKRSEDLTANDGMIIVDGIGKALSRYVEYDFYDAHWGLAEKFGPGRIWKDSVEGIYLSDVAIKMKAEHPERGYPELRAEAENQLDRFPVEGAIQKKEAGL